ncbi:MAG: hypothetical protein VB095_07760 [Anaerovorax sp.]|nr:hypothetical protein [Anaerovorax sp.]
MDFVVLKHSFLQANPNYENDVNNFIDYMSSIRGIRLPEQQDFLVNGMTTEHVIDSLKYYIDIGQIKKQEPARKYFVSIKQLFEYVLSNSNYKNDNFKKELANPAVREESYSRKTIQFLEKCEKLEVKEPLEQLENDGISKLIAWCNDVIAMDFSKESLSSTSFRRINAALCMKLIIFTGITYRVARQLEFSNLKVETNEITIMNFDIRLPLDLSKQFQRYYSYRVAHLPAQYLFVDIHGNQWGEKTSDSGIPNFMKTAINQTNITGIVKHGLSQLIKCGVNDSVIMKLTGASYELLASCLEDAQEKEQSDWNKYINSKLIMTKNYYEL